MIFYAVLFYVHGNLTGWRSLRIIVDDVVGASLSIRTTDWLIFAFVICLFCFVMQPVLVLEWWNKINNVKQLANRLFDTWDRSFSDVLCWIRLKLALSLLRVVAVCLHGSHTKWRSLGVEDGAAIRMFDWLITCFIVAIFSARIVNLYEGILFLFREIWRPVAYSNSEWGLA